MTDRRSDYLATPRAAACCSRQRKTRKATAPPLRCSYPPLQPSNGTPNWVPAQLRQLSNSAFRCFASVVLSLSFPSMARILERASKREVEPSSVRIGLHLSHFTLSPWWLKNAVLGKEEGFVSPSGGHELPPLASGRLDGPVPTGTRHAPNHAGKALVAPNANH